MLAPRALNTTKNPINFCSTYLSPVPSHRPTRTHTDILLCRNGRAKTIRAQGAPTIYPLVCSPVDKVFCLCSSVCVEQAQRAGGVFMLGGGEVPRHERLGTRSILLMSARTLKGLISIKEQ